MADLHKLEGLGVLARQVEQVVVQVRTLGSDMEQAPFSSICGDATT
jgi:hypothetical protein